MIETDLEKELARLERADLPIEDKKRIRDFVYDIKLAGLSINRQYFYAIRLRQIASIIPDKFLNPSDSDIKEVLATLMSGRIGKRVKGNSKSSTYSEWEIENYKSTLKKFYPWLLKNSNPECISWIKTNNHPNKHVKPENMITENEVQSMIGTMKNARDKALTYTLYDSGCRTGELLTLRNKDIEFDDYGAILSVTGKTGYRRVRIVGNSISYLREWQNAHPDRNNQNAWFFCGIESENRGQRLEHANVYKFIRKAVSEAKLERRIYPHLFRHTRATILATRVTEAPLEAQMGWVHGSRMTQTYVHLSGRDQDNAILKAYGIEVPEEKPIETDKPVNCPRCKEPNDNKSRFCWKCGMVLDKSITETKLREDAKVIEKSILSSEAVDNMTKEIVKEFPEEFKDLIIESVLQKIINSPDLRAKFTKNAGAIQNS
jgi:integrase